MNILVVSYSNGYSWLYENKENIEIEIFVKLMKSAFENNGYLEANKAVFI